MTSNYTFIYDGECPFCNHFAELLEIKSIDRKTIVAFREEILKKVNGEKGFNNISLAEYNLD